MTSAAQTVLTFVRCGLTNEEAAMWALHAGSVLRPAGIEAQWLDVAIESFDKVVATEDLVLSLIVLGIHPDHFAGVATKLPLWKQAAGLSSPNGSFVIAWFPDSDTESRRLCLELGCDAVIEEPRQVRAVMRRLINGAWPSETAEVVASYSQIHSEDKP